MKKTTDTTSNNSNFQQLEKTALKITQYLDAYIEGLNGENFAISNEIEISRDSNLRKLISRFNLSDIERDILLLCVAREILPKFQVLLNSIKSKKTVKYICFQLVREIFPHFSWQALSPNSPLLRWQLISLENGPILSERLIKITPTIFYYLVGESSLDPELEGILISVESSTKKVAESHQKIVNKLASLGSFLSFEKNKEIGQLVGNDLVVKREIANAVSNRLGFLLASLNAYLISSNTQEQKELKVRIEREFLLNRRLILLECDEISESDYNRHLAISRFIDSVNCPIIISTAKKRNIKERPCLTFEIERLTKSEQLALWQSTLGDISTSLNGEVERLVSQFNLNLPQIQAACSVAFSSTINGKKDELKEGENQDMMLWDTCRTLARPNLDELAQRITCRALLDDLVLPEKNKQTLQILIDQVKQSKQVYYDWGFEGKSTRGLGITALFSGVPGTGKTTAAEVVANALSLDLYCIDLSTVVSKYIGETEKNLRKIFDAAEAGGAVLLFDEADSLFGKRIEVKDSKDRNANVQVSYLLQRMEAYRGLAILTTNIPDAIDAAFKRRLRFIINFPYPDETARAIIWKRAFPATAPILELNLDLLKMIDVSGGNIRSIALNAAFEAAAAGEAINMTHILVAAKKELRKLDRSCHNLDGMLIRYYGHEFLNSI